MTKSEILARHEELLTERGNLFDEVLNASEPRKIEIKKRFDEAREELKDLLKQMRELYV